MNLFDSLDDPSSLTSGTVESAAITAPVNEDEIIEMNTDSTPAESNSIEDEEEEEEGAVDSTVGEIPNWDEYLKEIVSYKRGDNDGNELTSCSYFVLSIDE